MESTTSFTTQDASVVHWVQKLLEQAVARQASDVHFEMVSQMYRVRYRLDGILQEVETPPKHLAPRIAARIKVLAGLDVSEKRLPQDGQFGFTTALGKFRSLRVSTCPTSFGEKLVVRLLAPHGVQMQVDALGFSTWQKNCFLNAITQPEGLILITGPTGSGKTSTLYSALNCRNTPDVNIVTVEDPIEIEIPGINQVGINPKAGLTFARLLKAFLRQDPDIVMIGEIRDRETAAVAIEATQTGHLVFSTLHASDALDTIHRLLTLGVSHTALAQALTLIVSQRLVRKLCEYCKVPGSYNALPKNTQVQCFQPSQCARCNQGYKNRLPLFEVLPIDITLKQLIAAKMPREKLQRHAQQQNVRSLRQEGIQKVQQGLTTWEEVQRVTRECDGEHFT